MTAGGDPGGAGLLATAIARAEAWFLEPVEPAAPSATEAPRPVVAVRGLAPGCGTSTVARGLAATLASRDPRGAAIVVGRAGGAGPPLASSAAVRLAKELAACGCEGARAAGRLCLVSPTQHVAAFALQRPCPVVLDISPLSEPDEGLSLADHVVLIASAGDEPAMSSAVAACIARAGHSVEVVVNRVHEAATTEPPEGAELIPEARLPAHVAHACRGARAALAEPLGRIAGRCLERARA